MEIGLIAARVVTYTSLMLAAGIPLYLLAARRKALLEGAASRTAGIAALVGVLASLWWMLEGIAAMAALPLAQLDWVMVTAVLEATPLGTVLAIRLFTLCIAAIALLRQHMVVGALAALLALATTAWTGHAGATEAGLGTLHRASDVAHLIAAAIWLGALFSFIVAVHRGRDPENLIRHLSGFAAMGTIIVLLLLFTGLANTLIIAGWPIGWRSEWIALLMVKLTLFLIMLVIAAGNRWRLTPMLENDPEGSLRALKVTLFAEIVAALGIVGIVGWIGTLSPV